MQTRFTLALFSAVVTLATITTPGKAQTAQPINTRPTLGNIEDRVVRASDATHYVELKDISPGTELDQQTTISVSTTSDVIKDVEVDATSNGNAYLKFRTTSDVTGKSVVTITVSDNGQNPQSITRTFTITVNRPERVLDNPTVPTVATKKIATLSTYPNPTIGPSRITFSTVKSERTVMIETFNAFGAKTHQLFNGSTEAGRLYSVPFDRKGLTPGVYMIRLTSSEGMEQTRLLLTR